MNKLFSLKERSRYRLLRKMQKGFLSSLQNEPIVGIETYMQEIDTLISREDLSGKTSGQENLPILIAGDPSCGKSSLIAHWIKNYSASHKTDNDYFLVRFAKLSPNDTSYEALLYSIYTQLRVSFM
jgi:hypothetical protein